MKRLTYFCLIAVFVAANALLFVGCGCDDDDDDTADGGTDASEGTGDSGAADKDTGTSETEDSGASETKDSGSQQTEDTGVSVGDAAVDSGPKPVVYACGGDEAECDLLDEESCGDGEGCQFLAPASGGAPFAQCVDVGDGDFGDTCDDDNPCKAGLQCSGGSCYKYCCTLGSTDECPDNQACRVELLDQEDDATGVLLCDDCDECDPLTSEECGEGLGCYPVDDKGCRLCLESEGEKEAGESCDSPNDCKPGIGCYDLTPDDEEDNAICMQFCDLTADEDPCDDDSTCIEYEDTIGVPEMDKAIGLCTPNKPE